MASFAQTLVGVVLAEPVLVHQDAFGSINDFAFGQFILGFIEFASQFLIRVETRYSHF